MNKKYLSFIFLLIFALSVVCGISVQPAAAAKPYDPSEAAAIKAFLESNSMVEGKTNAEVLGPNVDVDDPGTWRGVSWIDYLPDSVPGSEVYLDNQHVLHIDWSGYSLSGNVNASGFQCMQTLTINNYGGSVGERGQYPSINISNNPYLFNVNLSYISAGPVNISGNPKLENARFTMMDSNTFTFNAPILRTLSTTTMGGVQFDFSNYPQLEDLTIEDVDVVENISLDNCSKIKFVSLSYLDELKSISYGPKSELLNTTIYRCNKLSSVDLSAAPKLVSLTCDQNASLAAVTTGSDPSLKEVRITRNPALKSLSLTGLTALETAECRGNITLEELTANSDPALREIICYGNALTTLDLSGLSALKILNAMDNQLTTFSAPGSSFDELNLQSNKLTDLSAVVGGSTINMHVYQGKGGYVELFAFPDDHVNPTKYYCDLSAEGLDEPYNTSVFKTEGSGWPEDQEWDERFTLSGAVDATVYFCTTVMLMDYFEDPADNPYGQFFGVNYPVQAVVGDPVGPIPPASDPGFPALEKDGYLLQGWYADEALTQQWDLESDIVEQFMYLYPSWIGVGTPYVISVERQSPEDEQTEASNVTFLVTFSEVVSGVSPDDFTLTTTGTVNAAIDAVSSSTGTGIEVTVKDITGSGTLRLDVKDSGTGIMDADENTLSRGYSTGEIYTINNGGGGPDPLDECFIATAAFGSKFTWPVALLRQFRDQYLLTNHVGTVFVKLYYQYSPPIAHYIAAREGLKFLVRVCLAPFIAVVYMLYHPIFGIAILILLSIRLLFWVKHRRRPLSV